MNQSLNGFFMICLPEPTLEIVQQISKKTNKTLVEVISKSIEEYAEKEGIIL